MKARAIFCSNEDELEKCEDLGIAVTPDLHSEYIYFKLSEVSYFCKNDDGNIGLSIYGERIILEWDKDVWKKLVIEFGE